MMDIMIIIVGNYNLIGARFRSFLIVHSINFHLDHYVLFVMIMMVILIVMTRVLSV